jgi:hypothetical protein
MNELSTKVLLRFFFLQSAHLPHLFSPCHMPRHVLTVNFVAVLNACASVVTIEEDRCAQE